MKLVAILALVLLELLLWPLAVVGIVLVAYRQLITSRRLGVSGTAIEVINGRWTMHVFGMRSDPATRKLAGALPNTSTAGLWMTLFPLWVAAKINGGPFLFPRIVEEGREEIRDLLTARTLSVDRILESALATSEQFLLMGAGYDTRAYGPLTRENLACFEVDQAATQRLKREGLARAGIDTAAVRFVTVDFTRDDIFSELREAGYDPTRRSVFLWEGVTMYLGEKEVRGFLRQIRENAAPGSVIVADFLADRMARAHKKGATKKALELTNEQLRFSFDFSSDPEAKLRQLVEAEGLTLGGAQFFGAQSGEGPFMVVAEMAVTA